MVSQSVTVFNAARSKQIEDSTVISGTISGDNLILTTRDGTQINAGNVRGLPGTGTTPSGPAGGVLSGTYPNPGFGASKVLTAALADLAVTAPKLGDNAVVARTLDPTANPSQMPSGGITTAAQAYVGTGWEKITSAATEDAVFPLANGCVLVNSGSTSGIQVPVAGRYYVTGYFILNANTTGPSVRGAGIVLNADTDGSTRAVSSTTRMDASNFTTIVNVSGVILCAANDIIQGMRYTSATNGYGSATTRLKVCRIG